MNAAKEVYERDRASVTPTIFGRGEHQPDVQNRKKEMKLYQAESHKMKSLLMNGASLRMGLGNTSRPVNPIWSTFPTRCVQPIRSTEEMKRKLEYFAHTDEVMLVRYHQNNCTACNALDKSFEFLCHDLRPQFQKLRFFDVNKDDVPELAKGLVRFPQVKGYSGGQWVDLDFKPNAEYREHLYKDVEREVRQQSVQGTPVTAIQAEEMYFSAAGPSMLMVLEENVTKFYIQSQVRMHNYWKQVSARRSWFFKKFIEPRVDEALREEWQTKSLFGEKIPFGPEVEA